MIGLGSNRMSVCRRGGMSVTQAGKGGMEWLAGGRRPRWSSPYSAQATAALKAQFPTQWPTIRDYGFAHPEIVGYMNAYAPEDAKIAYSLVEGIGIRYVNTNGGWIVMRTKSTKTIVGTLKCNQPAYSAENSLMIGCPYWQGGNAFLLHSRKNLTHSYYHGGTTSNPVFSFGEWNYFEMGKTYIKANGVSYATPDGNQYIGLGSYIQLGGMQDHAQPLLVASATLDDGAGNEEWVVPFIRNNVNGFLDLKSDYFYTKGGGSGSFTISETPS